jgi:hypothetical protein
MRMESRKKNIREQVLVHASFCISILAERLKETKKEKRALLHGYGLIRIFIVR